MSRLLLIALLGISLFAMDATAQGELPSQFSSGNDYFQVEIYLEFLGQGVPTATIYPGEGLTGSQFRDRPDGGTGWLELINEAGMSSISVDWPGTGNAMGYFNRDLMRALDATVEGAYLTGRGSLAQLNIAHAEGAALLTKTRSFGDYLSRTAVLIDPIGPQHAQPLEPVSFEQALARQETFEDDLWRRLGFGPRAGVLGEGLDIDLQTANAVFGDYQRDAFPIRPALLQPLISPIRVRGTGRLEGWRVLIMRTPAADDSQINREEAFAAWLLDAGVHVEHIDLSADPALAGTTGLPWIGSNAPAVLEIILDWYREAIRLVPELRDLDSPGGS